jgi:hypothetical protein
VSTPNWVYASPLGQTHRSAPTLIRRKIELVKRNKLLVHNLQLRLLAVIPPGHTMKRAIVFRIFCRGNSISINGTMGISAAAARTTSALTPKGKNLIRFTVS